MAVWLQYGESLHLLKAQSMADPRHFLKDGNCVVTPAASRDFPSRTCRQDVWLYNSSASANLVFGRCEVLWVHVFTGPTPVGDSVLLVTHPWSSQQTQKFLMPTCQHLTTPLAKTPTKRGSCFRFSLRNPLCARKGSTSASDERAVK